MASCVVEWSFSIAFVFISVSKVASWIMIVAPFPAERKRRSEDANQIKSKERMETKVDEITARTCVATVNEFPVLRCVADAEPKRITTVDHRD